MNERCVQGQRLPSAITERILLPVNSNLMLRLTQSLIKSVTRDEPLITRYDTVAGDGDCGETLLNGVYGKSLPFFP